MSIEKSIGWTDMTLNPIKGMCKGGCWYCWTKGFYDRNFLQPELKLDLSVLNRLPKKPRKIFICSTHDLFGDWISETWRDLIFANFSYYPQHTFQILTKYPHNIKRDIPDNVWLGVSITKSADSSRLTYLKRVNARIKFVSYEPMLKVAGIGMLWYYQVPIKEKINWLIMGCLTGKDSKIFKPEKRIIQFYTDRAKEHDIPIFMKNNLKSIWGENLIQEFPDEKND